MCLQTHTVLCIILYNYIYIYIYHLEQNNHLLVESRQVKSNFFSDNMYQYVPSMPRPNWKSVWFSLHVR